MYLIFNGHTVFSYSKERSGVADALQNLVEYFSDVFLRNIENHNSWMRQQFGTEPDAYVAQQLSSLKVLHVGNDVGHIMGYNYYSGTLPDGMVDLTTEFVEYVTKKVVTGQELTATIVKKGLKSTGKSVKIMNEVGGGALTEPAQIKELLDKLTRVNVYCQGWGKMSVSPDSLGDIGITPKYTSTRALVIKLEESV